MHTVHQRSECIVNDMPMSDVNRKCPMRNVNEKYPMRNVFVCRELRVDD